MGTIRILLCFYTVSIECITTHNSSPPNGYPDIDAGESVQLTSKKKPPGPDERERGG